MQHRLERFHLYWFGKEIYVITDNKPLVTMVSKDAVTLSHYLHCMQQVAYKPLQCVHHIKTGP